MVRSIEAFAAEPTYLGFFELTRSPFAAIADSSQQFESEQYWLLMEHLAQAAKNADSLVVVCGADGSGKSTLIRRFMGTLKDQVSCVLIDGSSYEGVIPFYSKLLTQIGFEEITGTENELRNIAKEFLVCRGIARDHVLVIIDNTHLADPRILEQVRRLCDVKVKDRRAISLVLFGNADIVRVVDAPAMKQTVFPNHLVFNIRNYTEPETASYIWHRLELAGAKGDLKFSDAVCSLIHRYSGGIPDRINKLCLAALEEAHRARSRVVSVEVVRTVINRLQLLPHVNPLSAKGRRRTDPKVKPKETTESFDSQASQQKIAELSGQIGELSAVINDLESSKAHALQELDARNRSIAALRDEIGSQKKEVETLSQSLANHATIIARQNQELSRRTAAWQESDAKVKRLATDLYKELRSREAAQEQLDKANAAIVELTRTRDELQATLETTRADLRDALATADQRAHQNLALEKAAADLKTEIAAKTAELESLRANLESLRVDLAARDGALSDLKVRLESQSMADAAVISQQNLALFGSAAALQDSEARIKQLAAELDKELRSREAAQEKLANANTAIDALTRSKEELQIAVAAARADLRDARAAAEQRAGEAEELERTASHLKLQIAEKTAELDSLRGELTSRNQTLSEMKVRLETELLADRDAITQQNKALFGTTAALQDSEARVKELAAELNKELRAREAAQEQLHKAHATIEELSRSRQDLQATIDAVTADLRSGRSSADQQAIETQVLEKTTALLRTDIAAKAAEVESLRKELVARNEALDELQLRLETELQANHAAAAQQNQALSDSTAALRDSEARVKQLTAELDGELRTRETAQRDLDKANAAVVELTRAKHELQATVDALGADLRSGRTAADHMAAETGALERATAQLRTDIAEKTAELQSARSQLASRNAALADLEAQLDGSRTELEAARSQISTLKDPAELEAVESRARKLSADLEDEQRARSAAEKELADAAAGLEELSRREAELQTTVHKLEAELKSSRERAFTAYALERNVTDLQEALEERTSELNARAQIVTDLEQEVETLKKECESLRSRAVTAESKNTAEAEPKPAAPEPVEAEPAPEQRTYASHVVALYENSLRKIPAYRTLKKYDPVFYDSLIKNYQVLVGQDLSEKQINDSLRNEQARWIERKLQRAADGAIVAYARLLVEQLREFMLYGTEPCFSLLFPRANPVKGVVPNYSEITRERELDILNMVLATYDPERALPEEKDVWPYLEPIFVELFEKYGADNVAAIENSFDPKMDRVLISNVSKTLYERILKLPEPAAAAVLRWMFPVK